MIGTGRGDVLAVDLDIEPVVGEAMYRGQARDAAVGRAVDPEQVVEQFDGVGGGQPPGGEPLAGGRGTGERLGQVG